MLGGVWHCSALCFLAKRFQLHALSSRKKGGVVRAPKEVLHKLFFVELLHSRVCGAVPNTPLMWPHTWKPKLAIQDRSSFTISDIIPFQIVANGFYQATLPITASHGLRRHAPDRRAPAKVFIYLYRIAGLILYFLLFVSPCTMETLD